MQNGNYTTDYKEVLPQERSIAEFTPPPARKPPVDDKLYIPNPFNHDPQSRRLRAAGQQATVRSSLSGDPGLHRVINRATTISQELQSSATLNKEQIAAIKDRIHYLGRIVNWERNEEASKGKTV